MHAVRSPFTGLIVASVSVAMIGVIVKVGKADLKTLTSALVAVLTVKFLLSPHSSPSAYLAVSFQAFAGFAILSAVKSTRIAMILFGVVALVESAMQKVIVLYILFGSSLNEALVTWQGWIAKKYNLYLSWLAFDSMAYIYVGVFAVVGLLAGWLAANLISKLERSSMVPALEVPTLESTSTDHKRRGVSKRLVTLSIVVLLLLGTYLISDSNLSYLPWLRVIIFVLLWIVVVLPLFKYLGQRYLFKSDVSHITGEFAQLRSVFNYLWEKSKDKRWISKVTYVVSTFVSTYLLMGSKSKS